MRFSGSRKAGDLTLYRKLSLLVSQPIFPASGWAREGLG
jgi:hypothetical protein